MHPHFTTIEAYRQWFESLHWHLAYTLTARKPVSEARFRRLESLWVCRHERQRLGPRWQAAPEAFIRVSVIEPHASGQLHIHGLLHQPSGGFGDSQRRELAEQWHSLAGFAEIKPVTDQAGAIGYYLLKAMQQGGQPEVFALTG